MLEENKNSATTDLLAYDSSMLNILLENLPCMAMILKKDTRQIVYSNAAARQVGAVLGQKCYETFAHRSEPCPFCLACDASNSNQQKKIEVEYEGKWYGCRWIPLTNDLYLHYIFDITEHKKTEENLRRSNEALIIKTEQATELALEAQKANSTKNNFLATMSHELRTPLNSVIGFSEILSLELSGEQKKYAELIYSGGQRLLLLISDILDLSRIESEKINLKIALCPLNKIIEQIEYMMRPFADEKKIDFKINISGNLPETIAADSGRFEQCVANVVSNAIKFTENGHVFVNISTIERGNNMFIVFEVEDTGIGIAQEFHEKIFESFVQEDGTMSRRYGGVGLGLTISKNLAKLLGGNITLKSEKGKGATFKITLPLNVDESPADKLCKSENAASV
jgi:signal transduction histidine kinase